MQGPSSGPPSLPKAETYSSGARLLRAGWILLGSAFAAVLLFIGVTVIMLKFREPPPADPTEQTSRNDVVPPAKGTTPSGEEKDPQAELLSLDDPATPGDNLARADEVGRILGSGLKPLSASDHLLPVSEPPSFVPEPPRLRPLPQPEKAPPPPPVDPPRPADPPAAKPAPTAADAAFEQRLRRSEDELREQLRAVPELRVISDLEIQGFREAEKAADRQVRRGGQRGGVDYLFNVKLNRTMRQAAAKSGVSLMSGPNCQMDAASANVVQTLSKDLRDMGFVSVPGAAVRVRLPNGKVANVAGTAINKNSPNEKIEAFKEWCDSNKVEKFRGALATLLQMLQVEDTPTRLLLVRELSKVKGPGAAAALAKRAMVDLSPDVRQAAVAALRSRPIAQYVPVLLQGLRYPWAPVADHAAVALLTLKPDGAVPKLVDLLDQPNPSVPALDKKTNKNTVRELVRLNHMRNCLLCHAPSADPKDGLVRGIVPTPGQPLPRLYYAAQTGNFVRADITFLRQDFSVSLPVKDATPWPDEQRFDFVTRVRLVKKDELPEIADKPGTYPQREAVLYTLRGLTAKDGGDSSTKWRDLLGIAKDKPIDKTATQKKDNALDKTAKDKDPSLDKIPARAKDKDRQP